MALDTPRNIGCLSCRGALRADREKERSIPRAFEGVRRVPHASRWEGERGYRIFPRIESRDFNASTALVPEEACPRDPTVADCCPSVWEALKFARSDLLVKSVRLEARVVILVYDPSGSCRSSVCVVLNPAQPVHRRVRNSMYFIVKFYHAPLSSMASSEAPHVIVSPVRPRAFRTMPR